MSSVAVFDLDHPQVGVKAALLADTGVDIRLITLCKNDPAPFTAHEIERALEARRLPIESVQFHQYRACGRIALLDDKGRNGGQTAPGQVCGDPDFRRQPCHEFPSLKSRPISEYRSASSNQLGRTLTVRKR